MLPNYENIDDLTFDFEDEVKENTRTFGLNITENFISGMVDDVTAQTAAANHQNALLLQHFTLCPGKGGNVPRITPFHGSAASHRGEKRNDVFVLHFRFRLLVEAVDQQDVHFPALNIQNIHDVLHIFH